MPFPRGRMNQPQHESVHDMERERFQYIGNKTICFAAIMSGMIFIAGCSSVFTPFGAGNSPESKLVNTYWQLSRVADQPITAAKPKRRPYILLTSDNHQFQGFAGCNNIHGRYKRGDRQLRFTTIAQTRMMCRGHMQTERALIQALDKTRHMRIKDHTLFLMNAGGEVLARFDARLKQFKGG